MHEVGYGHNCVMTLIILKLKLFYSRHIFQELLVGSFQRIVIPFGPCLCGVPTSNETSVQPFDDR